MEVKVTSKEVNKKELYFLTKAQNAQKMSTIAGQTIELDYWAIYNDTNSEGEEQTIFSCVTPEGEIYATNSDSFIRCVNDMLDVFTPDEIDKIEVLQGESKNGRKFITCVYVD